MQKSIIRTFLRLEDLPHLLSDMVTADIYVRDSWKLVPEDSKTGTKSRKSYINVDTFGSDPTLSAAAIPSNVHSAESETPVSGNIC